MVTFRFYAELNDFLAPHRRQRRFARAMAGSPSVKDAIEALGVPHPEVDLILINGAGVDFSCRLHDGDDVAVYPRFRSIGLGGVARVGGDPAAPVRFVCDVHLGKLAAWLRLCGVDVEVREQDDEIASVAEAAERVALTRDVGLLKRSAVRHGYWVRETDPERQLGEVIARFQLAGQIEPFTRCLRCNTPLAAADAEAVAARVPPRARASFQHFNQCVRCGRVYWQGTHYARLSALIDRVKFTRGSVDKGIKETPSSFDA